MKTRLRIAAWAFAGAALVVGHCLSPGASGIVRAAEVEGTAEVHKKSLPSEFRSTPLCGLILCCLIIAGSIRLCLCIGKCLSRPASDIDILALVLESLRLGQASESRRLIPKLGEWAGRFFPDDDTPSPFAATVADIERQVALDKARTMKGVNKLRQLGLLGMLVGCLGTITGLISSYQVIECMRSPQPGDLAVGIYESLVNAATGLSIWLVLTAAGAALEKTFAIYYHRLRGVLSRFHAPRAAAAIGPARERRPDVGLPAPLGMSFVNLVAILICLLTFGVTLKQGDIEDVRFPPAQTVQWDAPHGPDRLTVNVHHLDEIGCDAYQAHWICRKDQHWRITIRGSVCTDEKRLDCVIREEADHWRTDPQNPVVSERLVMVRADALAPWRLVQQVYAACAAAGIYKIEVGAGRMFEARKP